MARRKKLIWFERASAVGGADEARRRGASQTASPATPSAGRAPDAYYGPLTLEEAGDGAEPTGAGDRTGRSTR